MPLYKRADSAEWWVSLQHRGRRIRRSTGHVDKSAAQRWHDELKASLWQERQAGRTLADALILWLKERPRTRNDINTVKMIRAEYKNRSLVLVNDASLRATFGDRSPGSFNRIVNVIRAALNLAHAAEWIESVPRFKRRKVVEKRARFLSADEWEALRAELPEHVRAMATFAIATGLRWQNVALMQWEQINLPKRVAWVHADQIKDRETLSVPLSMVAVEVLERQRGKDAVWVFPYNGAPVGSCKTAWGKAVKRAGLDGFRWHDLRHTWASWHVQNGTPLAVLQELGGWSGPAMVARYAHLARGFAAQWADNSGHGFGHGPEKLAANG